MPRNPGLWDGIPVGFSNGARLCKSQQVRQHGDGWMFPPHHCMRNSCGSQTRAPNNPKGIGASSPRLARNAYLGCAFGNRINANGVVAEVRRAGGNGWASTALRLGMFVGR